ncbi:hypothetical protein H4Q32_030697 [Labeo rohita]|uniref:Reverse transcriptase domain-containing protein n=1 Tax=Labeo rohita TaxID=84645 RepID=A0ABQ8LBG0_LABRO|nr:hypothetical protein H4Q32_030697 [Labeo rohita]
MFVKCRPFYLPWEFTAIVIVAVYILPCANAKDALRELYSAISEQQTNNPDGFFIIAGDFNHANLKSVLPKFYQHVNFATKGNNTLDLVYTTVKNAYKAEPRPHLGYSDHISVMLIPTYRPLLKLTKPVQKEITVWPDDATSTLQDCFQYTDLHEYTETVTAYIKKCIDDMTVTKTITTRANQKPWMTAEVRGLLKTRDDAFRSGDKAALKTARANLSRGIKQAKRLYAQKINNHFSDSKDTRSLWQAIQTITGYKPLPQACDDDTTLQTHSTSSMHADIRKTLSRVNPRKAAGPDNIPGRVLRDCAAQLTDVLTDIFNTSLSQAVVPTCLKSTSIIPVPKKSPVSCLNDYRPIALTPIMMKCFERLVMRNIKTSLPNTLDPLQFSYRPNRSMDDAISSTLHLALTHLENLINKLNLLGLNTSLCNWILDFLTGRPQSVRVGHNTSSTTTLSTGAPQGCVLSPLLFTLLTHDCTAKFSSNHIIKFADDTTVVGLISNNDETHYREEVAQLVEWCGANNLSLNVSKTKEVVMDFRRNSVDHPPLTIDSSAVERVSSTKFLGVHITEDLTWTTNTMGTIESVLTSCITVWYGNCSAADRKTLQRTVNTAAKIIAPAIRKTLQEHQSPLCKTAQQLFPPGSGVILESPVHPVTEGDHLILHCLYRHTTSPNLRADFYKDGSLIQNQTTEMSITTVSKSHEGFYYCKHPERGESPKSWISVRRVSNDHCCIVSFRISDLFPQHTQFCTDSLSISASDSCADFQMLQNERVETSRRCNGLPVMNQLTKGSVSSSVVFRSELDFSPAPSWRMTSLNGLVLNESFCQLISTESPTAAQEC